VPAVRMGRLAVDLSFKGQGLGGALLADTLDRAARSEIAAYALMVDAFDEIAVAFYKHHGFIALADSTMALFLPFATQRSGRLPWRGFFVSLLRPQRVIRTHASHRPAWDLIVIALTQVGRQVLRVAHHLRWYLPIGIVSQPCRP
jgi:hypothetical protein